MTQTCYEFEGTRYLRNRHNDGCDGTDCAGCQQCGERHCGECRQGRHLGFGENTCPSCIGHARSDLREILDLYALLPEEAETKGINSEAAMLSGAAADTEAFAWRRAYIAARDDVPVSSLEPDDEHHPGNVLGRYVVALGEDYGDPMHIRITVSRAVDYLDQRLGRIAHDAGQDFGQFKSEIGKCKRHLELILRASPMGDRANVGCFDCGKSLERRLTDTGFEDVWTCRGCRRRYTYAEYNFALRARLEESA